MREGAFARLLHKDPDPPLEVSLVGLQVLQAEATIALCDAIAEIGPADQAAGLRYSARTLGNALVQAGLR